ncbi:MAG: hypothetical protein QNK98_14025 [Yoonia sp.]
MRFVFSIAAVLAVSACQAKAPQDIEVIKAPAGMSEVEFAKTTLNRLQGVSFSAIANTVVTCSGHRRQFGRDCGS